MSHAKKIAAKNDDAPEIDPKDPRYKVLGRGRYRDRRIELTLAGLRTAAGETQVAVSAAATMAQGDVSKLERRDDLSDVQVSTLRRYLAALGFDLELVAVRDGKRIVIRPADRN